MIMRLSAAALVLSFVFHGCIASAEGPFGDSRRGDMYPSAELASSYTRTEAVLLDGVKVGYTLTFLEVPPFVEERQYIQAGTRFINNLNFERLGFITPYGRTYRFDAQGNSHFLHHFDLEKNLAVFFGKPLGKVELKDI